MTTAAIINVGQASTGTGFASLRTRVGAVISDTDPEQAYFWTSSWQSWEREAEEDLRSGRFKDFSNLEDLLRDLDQDT